MKMVCIFNRKGKGFYDRLKNKGFIALTGMREKDTLPVWLFLFVEKCVKLEQHSCQHFSKNPYMNELYPSVESMSALTVFQLYEKEVGMV